MFILRFLRDFAMADKPAEEGTRKPGRDSAKPALPDCFGCRYKASDPVCLWACVHGDAGSGKCPEMLEWANEMKPPL